MPTVPIIPSVEMSAGSAGTFSAPDVQSMENFSPKQQVELSKSTLSAGVQAMRIQQHIEDELRDARTKEYDMKFADAIRQNMYNAETGYLNSVGKDAVDRRGDTEKAIQDARKQIEQGITDPLERTMFARAADVRTLDARTKIDSHSLQQLKVYNIGESKARVDNLMDDAVLNAKDWQQPGSSYDQFKRGMQNEASNLARLSGVPEGSEQFKAFQRETNTKLHATVISNFISQENPGAAEAYLKANKGEIDKEQLDQIQTAVRNAKGTVGVKEGSLRLSYEIKGGSLTEQIGAVDEMFKSGKITAAVRDATVQRVEHNWSVRNSQKNENSKAQMGAAQEWILKNPGKSVMDMPTPLYNWAKDSGNLSSLDGFAQREGRPAERQLELKTRGELLNMAMNEDTVGQFLNEFKQSGFQTRTDLGVNGIKEMQNIAMQIMQNNGRWKTTFDQKLLQDGIPANLLKTSAKDKKDAFVAIMAEKQQDWISANPGKAPKPEDYKTIISSANEEYVSLGFWNRTKKAYEIRSSEGSLEGAVPKWFFDQAKAARVNGRELSNDQISRAWQNYKQGNR